MIYGLIMKMTIPMDRFGRLVLPKPIRQSLNATAGAQFEAEVVGNRLELVLSDKGSSRIGKKGKLLVVRRLGAEVDAAKAVEETRRGRL